MNRRTVFCAIAAIVGTTMLPGAAAQSAIREGLAEVLPLFPSVGWAMRTGRLYLNVSDGNKSHEVLLEELGLTRAAFPVADQLAAIRGRRHADFASGALITIDGWVLARSEAAACALLALGWRDYS